MSTNVAQNFSKTPQSFMTKRTLRILEAHTSNQRKQQIENFFRNLSMKQDQMEKSEQQLIFSLIKKDKKIDK